MGLGEVEGLGLFGKRVEKVQTMITCRLSSIVFGVAAYLISTACQAAIPPCEDNRSGSSAVHENARPEGVRPATDENLVRVRLLMADAVQKDLGMTADQMRELEKFVKFSRDRLRELTAYWPVVSVDAAQELPEARKQELQKWIASSQRRQKEFVAQIIGMLTSNQSERLRQIQLQQNLVSTLVKPEFIKALGISEEQLERIRSATDRIAEKRSAELHGLDAVSAEQRRKKFIELTKKRDSAKAEANRLALNVLRPAQRVQLEEFVGELIEVTWDYGALDDDGN